MELFVQLMVTGTLVGSIYALVALGWTLIYKSSGVLNLAMGELTLIGAYVCLTFYNWGIPFPLAILGSLIIGGVLGLLVERLVLRPLIGEPILTVIMVTVGMSFLFRGLVGLIWGTDTHVFTPPVFPAEPIRVGPITISPIFLGGFVAALLLLVVFAWFFQRTRWGLAMQATADDQMAALSLGVSAKLVYAIAWAIAFMAAGVGGIFLGIINGLNVSVSFLGLLVLPAVVLGGLNSVPGAIVGGVLIGILQNLAGGYLDPLIPGGIKEVFPLAFMAVVLLFKPYGLWGWQKIERV